MAAPLNNKNAETWTFDEAESLLNEAFELSKGVEYDFIGEIARDLGTYREIFTYLPNKFPQLEIICKSINSNLEANCFSHAKKGEIKEASAIINLKSNYGWTDRVANVNDNRTVEIKPIQFID